MYELIILFLTVFLFIPMCCALFIYFWEKIGEMPELELMINLWIITFVFSLMFMGHWILWLLLLLPLSTLEAKSTNGEFRRPQTIATALGMIWIVLYTSQLQQEIIEPSSYDDVYDHYGGSEPDFVR